MSIYFLWGGIGIFVFFLTIGLISGLVRGVKRASVHFVFFALSVLVGFFITKPISNVILNNVVVSVNGGANQTLNEFIISMLQQSFDVNQYATATAFIEKLPSAIVSPFLFIFLTIGCFLIFDIIYLIFSRVIFGSKKQDFANKKPYRAFGGLLGMVEGFLFMFLLFAPLTSLTKTYQEITELPQTQIQGYVVDETQNSKLQTIPEIVGEFVPKQVNDILIEFNNSLIGKVSGAGGINNLLFEGLSNFKFKDEKINLRQELLNLTHTYDNFVVVYNNVQDENFSQINITDLKKDIETFVNNGIFKTVVSDTIKDIITKVDLATSNLPPIVQDILVDVKTSFLSENFDAYEYLKHDIRAVVNLADNLFKSEIIPAYKNLENKDFVGILEIVNNKNTVVSSMAENLFEMNVVKDSFASLINFASEQIQQFFPKEEGVEIALNTKITDKVKMVEDTLNAVQEFLQLNIKLNVSDLLNGNDIIDTLSRVEDIDGALTQAGKALDILKNLELLVLTKESGEKVYVFDNILKLYNFEVLNDEVYLNSNETEKTKLDTYTKFFNFLKTPITKLNELGMLKFNEIDFDFNKVLDNALEQLKIEQNFLAEILLPFQQLNAMNLKEIVFNKVTTEISNALGGFMDFSVVEDTYQDWNEQLGLLGKALNALNQGDIAGDSYIKYMMKENGEFNVLMKELVNNNVLKEVFDPIFSAKIFKDLTAQVFDSLDTAIGEYTKVKPKTNWETMLKITKEKVIEDLDNILKITLNKTEDFTFVQIGQILDILKVNAYNDMTDDGVDNGTKNGVFNNIFVNIIWYLTGDSIDGTSFGANMPHEHSQFIKTALKDKFNITSNDEYYTVSNYADALVEIEQQLQALPTV